MNKRYVIKAVLDGKRPPYTPWSFSFTQEAYKTISDHFGCDKVEMELANHTLNLGNTIGSFSYEGNACFKDVFGVVWDRSCDKDIGVIKGQVLPEPTLKNYNFPYPKDKLFFANIDDLIQTAPDTFRVYCIGFSLYERAWTLRGMETLMMDFYDNPQFVNELLGAIADYNIAQIEEACSYDIDAVYFGDDWGQQIGLQMGHDLWRTFIYPHLKRMYSAARKKNKYIFIHSCGDVDELFDELIEMGLNCFNPFQPEVMDVSGLLKKYRGRLTFHGGLSTQNTLPYGKVNDVRKETLTLLELGSQGSYIFAPAHAVEGDVPLENILTFIKLAQEQDKFKN